jgi:hypothetical protein
VKTHRSPSLARTAARATAVGVFLATTAALAPAFADEPTSWEDSPSVSVFHAVLILFLIPLGLALVIALLAALPSLIKGDSYEPGQAWRSEGEWFGGPRNGLEAADDADPKQLAAAGEQGGTGTSF